MRGVVLYMISRAEGGCGAVNTSGSGEAKRKAGGRAEKCRAIKFAGSNSRCTEQSRGMVLTGGGDGVGEAEVWVNF